MEANQITVRLDDEEYVRSVWERVSCVYTPFFGWVVCAIVGGNVRTAIPLTDSLCCTEAEAWSAAAEYTRERLEQVRQLGEEIHRMECLLMPPPQVLIREAVEEMWPGDMALEYVREVCAYSRTIARLEAELATLTRGIRPEALEGATR